MKVNPAPIMHKDGKENKTKKSDNDQQHIYTDVIIRKGTCLLNL